MQPPIVIFQLALGLQGRMHKRHSCMIVSWHSCIVGQWHLIVQYCMRCVFTNTNLKLIKNTLIRKQGAVGILSCNYYYVYVCSPKRTKKEMEEKLALGLQAGLHSCTNPIAYREGCYLATGGYYEEMRILAHTIAQTFRRGCSEHSQTITFSSVDVRLEFCSILFLMK